MHKQGTYALQKVLESPCSASEFVLLGNELLKSGQDLLGGEPGIYVMAKLVEQLVSPKVLSLYNSSCLSPCKQQLSIGSQVRCVYMHVHRQSAVQALMERF